MNVFQKESGFRGRFKKTLDSVTLGLDFHLAKVDDRFVKKEVSDNQDTRLQLQDFVIAML